MQQDNYNKRHRAIHLTAILDHTKVWITTGDHTVPGKVVSRHRAPRSYVVETPTGEICCNRQHSTEVPEHYDSLPLNSQESDDPNELECGIKADVVESKV